MSDNTANCGQNLKENLAYLWRTAYNVLLKCPNQQSYHLGAPQPFSQVMLITLAFGRRFPPLCLILQYNTLQAQSSSYKSKGWGCIYFSFLFFSFFVPSLLVNMAPAFYLENLPSCVTRDVKEQRVKDGIRLVRSLPVSRASHRCDQQYYPVDLS